MAIFIVQSEHARWNRDKIDIISLFFPLYLKTCWLPWQNTHKIATFATYFMEVILRWPVLSPFSQIKLKIACEIGYFNPIFIV